MKIKFAVLLVILLALGGSASAQVNNARMLSTPNAQTGTTYTFVAADTTRVVTFSNAGAIAATLPNGAQAGFGAGTMLSVVNLGAGTVTITCSSCTINGNATLALAPNQGADIYGGSGASAINYVAVASPSGSSFATLSGNNNLAGNNTLTAGQNSINAKVLNSVISCDGVTYTGSSALQNAILALPVGGGTVDCSNPLIGTQTITANPFAAAFTGPVKVITGPYTIQYDATAFCMDLPNDTSILGYGTTWLNSTAQSLAFACTDTSGRSSQQETGILNNRVYGTTASTTASSNSITVASASNLRLGQTIAVFPAAGGTANQATTTNTGGGFTCSPGGTLTVTSTNPTGSSSFGSTTYQDSYIFVDNEVMSYSGTTATTFTGLACGLFGTTTVSHANGAPVQQALALISEIQGISGTTITLADNATKTLTGAFVQAGATNISIDGNMTFDANYISRASGPTGGTSFLEGLSFLLGSYSTIGQNIRLQNSAHGGVMVQASYKMMIGGHYRHIGRPSQVPGFGGDVWLFSGSRGNTVKTSSHTDGDIYIVIDDRSNAVTRWAFGSNDNNVDIGAPNTSLPTLSSNPIDIEGFSSNNTVRISRINAAVVGILLNNTTQWTTSPVGFPSSNTIFFSQIDSLSQAINASGGANNMYYGGRIASGSIGLSSANDTLIYQNGSGVRILQGGGVLQIPTVIASSIVGNSATLTLGDSNGAVLVGPSNLSGNTVALTADWTCGTGGTVSSCVAATIIGSGGGVPLTFTLPSVARSWTWECDGVVGQATAATANQWNILTATNGATNVTANYDMYTAATAKAGGAVTDQASTTTTFNIAPAWTLGGTATKMPFHIWGRVEGASASGTVLSLQLLAPTVGDLVTIYRGASCRIF